jgi:hypothetical protein
VALRGSAWFTPSKHSPRHWGGFKQTKTVTNHGYIA